MTPDNNKKIRIKRVEQGNGQPTDRQGSGSSGPPNQKNRMDILKNLETTVKKLSNRFNQFGYNDSKEDEFLVEYKGKEIILELETKTVEGILESIDKYRIGIIIDDILYYYYKHACVGYHPKP